VQGSTAAGQPFTRLVRATLGRVATRRAWRRHLRSAPGLAFVAAHLAAVCYAAGEVVGLRVRNGTATRDLVVAAPALRSLLATIEIERLAGAELRFGIAGDELLGIVRTYG
jgi:hypothetical protein